MEAERLRENQGFLLPPLTPITALSCSIRPPNPHHRWIRSPLFWYVLIPLLSFPSMFSSSSLLFLLLSPFYLLPSLFFLLFFPYPSLRREETYRGQSKAVHRSCSLMCLRVELFFLSKREEQRKEGKNMKKQRGRGDIRNQGMENKRGRKRI